MLLAADPQPSRDETNRQLWINSLLLIGALLVGALVIALVQRWYRRSNRDTTLSEGVGSFRQSYERGELTEEEYRRILTRMSGGKSRTPARPEPTPPSENTPPPEGQTPKSPAAE